MPTHFKVTTQLSLHESLQARAENPARVNMVFDVVCDVEPARDSLQQTLFHLRCVLYTCS